VTESAGARFVRRTRAVLGLPPVDRAAFAAIARSELPQIARIVIVATVSWQACVWLGADLPPVYAVLVPWVCLTSDPFSAFNLSWSRLVGVLIGLLVGVAVLQILRPGLPAVALVLGLALLIGMVIRIGNTSNIQVAVSALLVFVSPDAAAYSLTRLWETVVGTAVTAVLTPFLFPADPLKAARRELVGIANTLTTTLREEGRPWRSAAGTGGSGQSRGGVSREPRRRPRIRLRGRPNGARFELGFDVICQQFLVIESILTKAGEEEERDAATTGESDGGGAEQARSC
jgi:hypothetical protein